MKNQLLKSAVISVIAGAISLSATQATANMFNNNNAPNGYYSDYNNWPEWTPMYWMEEMSNEFDNNGWNNNYNYPPGPYGPPPVYGQPYGPATGYAPQFPPQYAPMPRFQAPPMAPNQVPKPLPPQQMQQQAPQNMAPPGMMQPPQYRPPQNMGPPPGYYMPPPRQMPPRMMAPPPGYMPPPSQMPSRMAPSPKGQENQ